MNRMTLGKLSLFLLGLCTLLLLTTNPTLAQTTQTTTPTTTTPPPKTPPPPAKPKPAPAQTPAKPTQATPAQPGTAAKATIPADPPKSPANPAVATTGSSAAGTTGTGTTTSTTNALTNALSTTGSSTGLNGVSNIPGASSVLPGSTPGNSSAGSASGSSGRSGLTAQGLGNFHGADYTLTAYGCYRTANGRVLCDFDITKVNSSPANLGPFYTVAIVDDGGKITARHDAYYMAADGSQMQTAYLSTTPVRYIMEYDNVSANVNTVSLIFASDRIQGVPVNQGDLSTAVGRGGSTGSGSGSSGQGQSGNSGNGGAGSSGGPRAGITARGLGDFHGADYTLTAYGCYRSNTRVLCDFDITKQNAAQSNVNPFYTVSLIDDGGKITSRHDAYFLGADGTQMPTAYLSTTPVRYIMEYDNVATQFTSGSLINGGDQIPNVPIATMSASQPTGTIPARGGAPAAGTATAQNQPGAPANGANPANPANATDQASQAVKKATDAKQKAKGLLDQLKSLGSASNTKPN